VAALLGPDSMWHPITVLDETVSTNSDLFAAAKLGADEGAVLIAEHQTQGRGRFTRAWIDVPGTNIAMSCLVRPKLPIYQWGWLSALAGMAVAAAIRGLDPTQAPRVELKWPNDVLLDGGKVCGIISDGDGSAAVLGIGINVGGSQEELPLPTAKSLALAGLPTDKSVLAAGVLRELERYYRTWNETSGIRAEYTALSSTIGRDVRVQVSETEFVEGTAVGVDEAGSLEVNVAGVVTAFAAGDVVHLR
jgi:BirA family biotin operon repressor/biotin-[acetyl-CoA-carboxylase] ligase